MRQAEGFSGRGRAIFVAVAVVACGAPLGGCGGLLQSKSPAAEVYRLGLRAVPSPAAAAAPAPPTGGGVPAAAAPGKALALTIGRPRAAESLDTERIAIAPGGSRFDYYTGVRWSEPAPQMLQQLLVASFQASGGFRGGVFAAPARGPSDLLLDVELRHFEATAAAAAAAPTVHVLLQASVIDSRRAERLVSFVSEASVVATQNRRPAIIDAFERASAQVVDDVVARVRTAAANAAAAPE